jgi:hypothetical protein
MVALHSSDPVTVYLSVWARVDGFDVGDLESLLYDQRVLFRIYGMRRTLWVVDRHTLPLVDNSSTRRIGATQVKRLVKVLQDAGVAEDGNTWLDDVIPRTMSVIRRHGEVPARVITPEVPEMAEKIVYTNQAGRIIGTTGLSTSTLTLMSLQSTIIRGRPMGSWISGQYRWAEMTDWLGEEIEQIPVEEASAQLIRMWLHTFGPGTEADMRWWTGWTAAQVRRALGDVGAVEVELEDGIGYLLPDDLEPVESAGEWVALLPSLDPTVMGWKERDWYLGDHQPTLFDRNGNAGPTIWVDGKVVGGWSQTSGGEVVYEILDDIGDSARSAVARRVETLQDWLGEVTVTPRFRSPHDRALGG